MIRVWTRLLQDFLPCSLAITLQSLLDRIIEYPNSAQTNEYRQIKQRISFLNIQWNRENIVLISMERLQFSALNNPKSGGAHGVMELDTAIRVRILDKTDCISYSTKTLGKGMNPIILPPAIGK